MSDEKEIPIWIKSIYGRNTKKALVELHYQDIVLQIEPEKAREIALLLLETAEAAEQDAFLVEWAKSECGADDRGALNILSFYREWRDKKEKSDAGNTV